MLGTLREALHRLWRDDWVLGIATAAALALTGIELVQATAALLTSVIDQPDFSEVDGLFASPWTVVIGGRALFLEQFVQSAIVFVVVLVAAGLIHRATRKDELEQPETPGDADQVRPR